MNRFERFFDRYIAPVCIACGSLHRMWRGRLFHRDHALEPPMTNTELRELIEDLQRRVRGKSIFDAKPDPLCQRAAKALSQLIERRDELEEALTDIRNRVLCPVGPSPTIEELQEIASTALSGGHSG